MDTEESFREWQKSFFRVIKYIGLHLLLDFSAYLILSCILVAGLAIDFVVKSSANLKDLSVEKVLSAGRRNVLYEFKFLIPMVAVSNYLPDADKGYGSNLVINQFLRKLERADKSEIVHPSELNNFYNKQPKIYPIPNDIIFTVIKKVEVGKGVSSTTVYIVKDPDGLMYVLPERLLPKN